MDQNNARPGRAAPHRLRPLAARIAKAAAGLCLAAAFSAPAGALAREAVRPPEDNPCPARIDIPPRSADAPSGSEFARRLARLDPRDRDEALRDEIARGNVPEFLRRPVPVRLGAGGAEVTVCAAPDYLAVGDDADWLYAPLRLRSALAVARSFGAALPTAPIVDAVYEAAEVKLAPQPLSAGPEMVTLAQFVKHGGLVREQRARFREPLGALVAGDKKDLVLHANLAAAPETIAIYGWHKAPGSPIQPLSRAHDSEWVDYSHGARLILGTVFVRGAPMTLAQALADPRLSKALADRPILDLDKMTGRLERVGSKTARPEPAADAAPASPTRGRRFARRS